MATLALVLGLWLAISVPVSIVIGRRLYRLGAVELGQQCHELGDP